jgi:hypothetical protein
MTHRLGIRALILTAFVGVAGLPANASATPVLWALHLTQSNGTGGTVVGSFVFDADTNLYSSIAITTSSPLRREFATMPSVARSRNLAGF